MFVSRIVFLLFTLKFREVILPHPVHCSSVLMLEKEEHDARHWNLQPEVCSKLHIMNVWMYHYVVSCFCVSYIQIYPLPGCILLGTPRIHFRYISLP